MKAILLGAIGVVAMLMWLREEPPPRAPAPQKAAAPAKVAAVKPQPLAPKPASSPAKKARKPAAAPKPQPLVVKVIPPLEKLPELLPVAAADPAPRSDPPRSDPPNDPPPASEPPPADPNSVFGWGPWTGGEPIAPAGGAPAAGGNAPPRVEGLTPGLSMNSPAASPPPVAPPPQSTSSIRPGHGFGDRNHIHIHRR